MAEFETSRVIEHAFAAYRINKGYQKVTRDEAKDFGTKFSNADLLKYQLHYGLDADSVLKYWIHPDFKLFTVTEEDIEAKNIADKHMRRYAMLSLGVLNTFEKDVYAAYSKEVTQGNRIGILAYFPEFVNRELEKKIYMSRLKTEFSESQVLSGRIVNQTTEILKSIPLPMYDTILYIGAIGKNLVSFSKNEKYSVGEIYQINARTKGSDMERDTKLPLTKLNYVKLEKAKQ